MKSVARLLRVLALVVIAFAPPLHGSPLTGAAVQTWRYNPQAKVTTITLSNLSPKDILAYNLTITSTYEDGSSDKEEVLTDLLDRKINATLVKGTPDEARFTERFGNGTFAARTTMDKDVATTRAPTKMQIVVDMVVYVDQTADVQNEGAFAQLTASRQGELLALQLANDTTQQSLTNPNPREAAVTELMNQIQVLRDQNLARSDPKKYELVYLQGAVRALENAPSDLPVTEHMKNVIAMRQKRIALAGPHAQLTKTSGELQ